VRLFFAASGPWAWQRRMVGAYLFCLTIEILDRPCRLVDEPIGLAFRVTRDAAKTFLHFAAHVPGGTGYTIFIHRSVLAGVILCASKPR
jgi:hypothetical protein